MVTAQRQLAQPAAGAQVLGTRWGPQPIARAWHLVIICKSEQVPAYIQKAITLLSRPTPRHARAQPPVPSSSRTIQTRTSFSMGRRTLKGPLRNGPRSATAYTYVIRVPAAPLAAGP